MIITIMSFNKGNFVGIYLLFILLEITNKNWLFYANKTKVGSIIFISIQNV